MFDALPLDSILKQARSAGGDFAEVFLESSQRTSVVCDDNCIEKVNTATDAGLGLRVLSDTRTAYGSTNDFSLDSLMRLASSVGEAGEKSKESNVVIAPIVDTADRTRQIIGCHPKGLALSKKVALVERANQIARSVNEKVAQAKIMLKDHVRRIWVASSDGTQVSDEQVYVAFIVQVVCADGEVLQTSYEPLSGMKGYEIFDETTPEEVAEIAAKRALLMLKAAPAPSGTMPVVIAGDAGGTMIHEAVGHGLEADLAGEGLSVYKERIGQKVATELISVIDDSTMPGSRGSFTYDDEGAPASKTVMIENGVLKTYLHNRITAARSNVITTGNGRRQNYTNQPIVRMTNTFIARGKNKLDDIIQNTDRGLFVKKMGGGQVNTINGDFVFDVQEGYRIESGKIGEPVRGATLTGNGPKVLEIIDRVGDDLGFSVGTCGKSGQEVPISCGQPSLRIPEIIVGGTA
jgi:TldD protein